MAIFSDSLPGLYPSRPSTPVNDSSAAIKLYHSDTTRIQHKRYVLSVYRGWDTCFFKVEREQHKKFVTILIDNDYTTNNSGIEFKDYNRDGYKDIIWTKKWQEHAYLFNPHTHNFVEVGEFNNVNTLKVDNQVVWYTPGIPYLYLINDEKDIGETQEKHSELFVIDNTYHKISFATIDNFSTIDDDKRDRFIDSDSLFITCRIPPYKGRWGSYSIWNSGNPVDSFVVHNRGFTSKFIRKYRQRHYLQLQKYGKRFTVRREYPLEYPRQNSKR